MSNGALRFEVGQLVEVVSPYGVENDLAHVKAINGDQIQISYFYADRREWRSAVSLRSTSRVVGYGDGVTQ